MSFGASRAGLDILRHPIHGSGNPVPWDIDHGPEHSELLGMLHVKLGDYAHWAVRIDRQTRRVTHLSAGPVIKARDYRNEVRSRATLPFAESCQITVCQGHT